jgi:hypothetical protein
MHRLMCAAQYSQIHSDSVHESPASGVTADTHNEVLNGKRDAHSTWIPQIECSTCPLCMHFPERKTLGMPSNRWQ